MYINHKPTSLQGEAQRFNAEVERLESEKSVLMQKDDLELHELDRLTAIDREIELVKSMSESMSAIIDMIKIKREGN